MLLFILVLSFLFMICVFGIYITSKYNHLKKVLYKISISEKSIKEILEEDEDLINRAINIIDKKTRIKDKTLEDIKKIKRDKFNSNDKDKLLTLGKDKIISIHASNKKSLKDIKSFSDIVDNIKHNNRKLIALRTYYNNNVNDYNNIIKDFPDNLIAKIKNHETKKCFEGNVLEIKKEI